MSRRYTSDEKSAVVDRLVANNGDVSLTSAQTGVPVRTIYKWKQERTPQPPLVQVSDPLLQQSDLPVPPPQLPQQALISGDDAEALRDLQHRMLAQAYNLVCSIQEAIDEAPLGQRVAALAQLIDRIIKLAAQLSQNSPESVIRIEYKYPDGTIHPAPPWAEEDTGDERPFPRVGVWTPFWQDHRRQTPDRGLRPTGGADVVVGSDLQDGESGLAGLEDHDREYLWDEP